MRAPAFSAARVHVTSLKVILVLLMVPMAFQQADIKFWAVPSGNLPSAISERDLEDEFIRFGTLRSVWVARKPPGFGEMPSYRAHQ